MYPFIAVVTCIEADHLDCYSGIDDIKDTFVQFTDLVPFYGAVFACVDDDGVKDVLPKIRRSVITYGVDERADYRAVDIKIESGRTVFDVLHKGNRLGSVSIGIPGTHNVRNTMAALSVACEIGINFDVAVSSVSAFQGVARRFEIVGTVNGATVVDDYAHHPGEISATLEAARGRGYHRVIAIFQPHLYSRTRDFMDNFVSSLSGADIVMVTDIYKARELPIPGVNASDIVDRINAAGKPKALYVPNRSDVVKELQGKINEGDLVIFMGAGDIWETARDLVTMGERI